jgi:hypothetical protein
MALNWNIEKCKNWKQLGTKKEWPVTDMLIWATMPIGINEITKQNFEEFYRRLHLIETTRGTFLMQPGGRQPYYITLAEVKRRIGLYTNAAPITKKNFDAKYKAPASTEA